MTSDFNANDWLVSVHGTGVAEPDVPYGAAGHRRNAVVDETFELASRVMDYSERLIGVNRVFADQVLRSGTSVGSHVREAQGNFARVHLTAFRALGLPVDS